MAEAADDGRGSGSGGSARRCRRTRRGGAISRSARWRRSSRSAHDARALDGDALAIGPFARLDAGAVAARDGKTRGAITNLFGSQAAYQAETMRLTLDAGEIAELADWPDPAGFADADAWVEALFAGQSARGPQHAAEPAMSYAALWVLWLGAVPYGLWSERVAEPSMAGVRPPHRASSRRSSPRRWRISG